MRFAAKDGTMHSSQKQAFDASQKPSSDAMPGDDQQGGIENDPKAMQLVDELKQMGYTADDVAQAMDDSDKAQEGGQAATQAAPLQIPGV